MTEHPKRAIAATVIAVAFGLFAVAVIIVGALAPEPPLMLVIDGPPHLRGAHQQKPGGVRWTPPLGGPQTVAGADVPREDSKTERQVMPNARGYGSLGSERPRGTSVAQRDSTSREGTEQKKDAHAHTKANSEAQKAAVRVRQPSGQQSALPVSTLRHSEAEAQSKEGVTDERSRTDAGHGDTKPIELNPPSGDLYAGGGNGAISDAADRVNGLADSKSGIETLDRSSGAAFQRVAVTETPWTNVTDQPWTNRPVPNAATRGVITMRSDASMAGSKVSDRAAVANPSSKSPSWVADCRPSGDTEFSQAGWAWTAKANTWADAIAAKYERAIAAPYDVLRCNGSIPYRWYVGTHNTKTGAAFSDETPVEWMCAQHMDSPVAAMMVRTLPVMRPTFGGPYDSVVISYNDHDRRIEIGEGTEYAGCGVTAGKLCQFRAAFPCVWPLWKLYDDGKGGAVAVVSGWDVKVPGRIEVGPKEAQP
jgi:hypothetical protein